MRVVLVETSCGCGIIWCIGDHSCARWGLCISIWSILGMQVHFTLLSLHTVEVQVHVMQVQVPIIEHCCSRRQNLLATITLHSNLNTLKVKEHKDKDTHIWSWSQESNSSVEGYTAVIPALL